MSCDYPEGCTCGASRVNELERENAKLREDKARLDWMAARGMRWFGGDSITREQIDALMSVHPPA